MTAQPDLSVVIPVHNSRATVVSVVESFLRVDSIGVEVIVVDDCSTDDSVAQVEAISGPVEVVRLTSNHGAGLARNHGFALAHGRYTLFFDADDEIHSAALVEAVAQLDDTGADVAMLPYLYRRGSPSHSEAMNSFDAVVWQAYATSPRRVVRLREAPRLLGFSNYPWNKVARTDHFRASGLRYGRTPVHNDILGHWLTLLDARSIVLLDEPLCTHIVAGGRNLTRRESRARLTLIDALEETYLEIERRPDKRDRYSHHYWDFVLRVAGWAADRMTPDVREEFHHLLQEHLLRIDLGDFTRIRLRRDPRLAARIVGRALA